MKDLSVSTKTFFLIILSVIAFFVLVFFLAWFAQDGNVACAAILYVFMALFMTFIFIVVPAFLVAAKFFPEKFFHRTFWLWTIFFCFFWPAVLLITCFLKPEWGWAYKDFADKNLIPLINVLIGPQGGTF